MDEKLILQIVKRTLNIHEDASKFIIEEQKGGLFNKVFKVTLSQDVWYIKQYLSQNNSSIFTPPNIPPDQRAQLAYNVQKACYECNQHISTIPNLHIDHLTNSLVIDGIKNADPLINFLSRNDINIIHAKLIASSIANLHKFYSTTNCINEELYANQLFKDFKLKLQYTDIATTIKGRYSKIINDLADLYRSQTITVLHGDLNSRNIVINSKDPSKIGIIDFEQSHVGNPIYDISYFLSEIYISCLYFKGQTVLKIYVEAFLSTYLKTFPCFDLKEYIVDLKLHLAVQILYRFLGPSKHAWTYYIDNINIREDILKYAKSILLSQKEEIIDSVDTYILHD